MTGEVKSMSKASQVIQIAMAEIGYKEKATNANLDLATANAGTGNWTKYARDLWNAGYYNGNKNGYAWCDVFVDWCFFKAFGKTEGQLIECQTGDLGAACPYSASYYKAQGRYDRVPKVGDQVFFQQNGSLVHTGIVVEVTSTSITTVEGNTSDMVAKRSYQLTNSYVAGFGHPKYTEDSDTNSADASTAPSASSSTTTAHQEKVGSAVTVSLNELQSGCKGSQVKTIQRILYARGIRDDSNRVISVDGDFGGNTKAAVIKLQKQLFPNDSSEWDGVVGKKTWAATLTQLW